MLLPLPLGPTSAVIVPGASPSVTSSSTVPGRSAYANATDSKAIV